MKATYKPQSFQRFHRAVGEATSYATGTHLCLNLFQKLRPSDEVIKAEAGSLEIRVDRLEIDKLTKSNIRLSIVSLYSAYDEFQAQLRREHQELSGKSWNQGDSDPPLTALKNNAPEAKFLDSLKDQFKVFEYYRKLRNWIVHPASNDASEIKNWYDKNHKELLVVGKKYNFKSAPNPPVEINIHDMKLYCTLLLNIAVIISESFDPGNEAIAKYVKRHHKGRKNSNSVRAKNAVLGYIQTQFGLSNSRAYEIYEVFSA